MAKLEGVKTLDMVNGEITKVEYNGEVYEKVDTPKKGDIGLFTEDSWVSISEGGTVFTEIIDVVDVGVIQVSSELGSEWYSEYLTYFRKPSAPSLKAGDKVRLISERPKYGFGLTRVGDVGEVRCVTGEDVIVDFPNHTYWSGIMADLELIEEISEEEAQPTKELFAKVNRPNNVPIPGDYVEFREDIAEECSGFLTVGKKYFVKGVDVIGDADITDDNGVPETAEPYETKAIYVKYTQEQAEKKAEVGDKVLVVDAKSTGGLYGNGDILTASSSNSAGVFVEESSRGLWNEEFIVLNPEQVGEAKAEAESVEEPEVEESQAEGVPFEVGQFVVEEGSGRYTLTIPEAGALEVVEVGEFTLGGDIRVKFHREFTDKDGEVAGRGETYPVNSDYFRLATNEEIVEALDLDKIKEGDKVEVLAEDHHLVNKGDTFTVKDSDGVGVYCAPVGYVQFARDGKPRIKLVEEGSKDLPVGTKVRGKGTGVTYTLYGRSPEYDGECGAAYYVNENRYGWIGEEQFEVISKPETIEVGDLVRVIDSPGALPEGSVFKVTSVTKYGNLYGRTEFSSDSKYIYEPKHVELVAKAEDVYV